MDRLYEAVKHYITKLTRENLEEEDGRRTMEIMSFAINLEHIGDIIDKNLMELAIRKIKHRCSFSREGAKELEEFHQRVLNNLRLSFSVFMSRDVKVARILFMASVYRTALIIALEEFLTAYELTLAKAAKTNGQASVYSKLCQLQTGELGAVLYVVRQGIV